MTTTKAVLLLFVLLASVTAQAAPPADCTGLMLASMNHVIYRSKATFPAEPTTVSLAFFDTAPAGVTSFCGYSFRPDRSKQVLTVTAPKLTALANVFRQGFQNTGKIALENRYYDLESRPTNVVFDPQTYQLTFDKANSPIVPLTLAVKIDGGSLQPLLYQNAVHSIRVPRTARAIDIYARGKNDARADWQRLTINLTKATVIFYKAAAFPTK